MLKVKKIILLCAALFWIANISFATPDTASQQAHSPTKPTHNTHHKKISKKKIHQPKKRKKHPNSTPAVAETATAPNLDNLAQATTPSSAPLTTLASSIEQRLVDFIYNSVTKLQYSSYKLGGGHVDPSHGIYIVDCSGYVDHTLRHVYPNAYSSLVSWSGSDKPNTEHYYDFFNELSYGTNDNWSKIDNIDELQPGDILVFRYKNIRGHAAGGHVMVVMNKPQHEDDTYFISVADSAPTGHSQDTRLPHVSGVGVGTLLLKANPKTGEPAAFAWKIGSRWVRNVKFAMARPIEFS